MSTPDTKRMAATARSRAEVYLHDAKVMVTQAFGTATEHAHAEVVAMRVGHDAM